ncbi:golgin subfamily A member 2-like isoform X2 [Spodoptera litura]|nr:golgin subfamily A member 2-like isoform X2 [Spodoptera litura]
MIQSTQEIQNPDFEANGNNYLSSTISNTDNLKKSNITENNIIPEPDLNITEILISNKRNLELQVHHLQSSLEQLEQKNALVVNDYKICNQKLKELEHEINNINDKYIKATEEITIKNAKLNELNSLQLTLSEENSNLTEQLEFTKSVLHSKEAESDSLHKQLLNVQSQYDVIHLQLQQLTNGSPVTLPAEKPVNDEKTQAMSQKISYLEQQLTSLQKERDQINAHYEHYVAELNEQLSSLVRKNEELVRNVENLSNRENSLIEQISDMEIRIQNYNVDKKNFEVDRTTTTIKDLQDNLVKALDDLNELKTKHECLQNQYAESIAKVQELSDVKEPECNHDNISLSKLNADMTSDKVAAQRATEQNKQLKQDIQRLEDAFVKMSKDKLELTEKITAEKYLNRELTIKLSEVEEKAKDMQIKLKAKDEEMIRLQSNYREIQKQCDDLMNSDRNVNTRASEAEKPVPEVNIVSGSHAHTETDTDCKQLLHETDERNEHTNSLQRADAMVKLQDRFLKIMAEVADLSDEKHRLEHIILQLQNETDTICEYVALYQQQRSLLKRRDEERSAQLKVFQQECGKLKSELDELGGLLIRFAEDKELSSYFVTESKRIDMERVMTLLANLKNNSLIDINKKNIEFKNFYPCNCCSGKLIDV